VYDSLQSTLNRRDGSRRRAVGVRAACKPVSVHRRGAAVSPAAPGAL
jgi:hypothetical protein